MTIKHLILVGVAGTLLCLWLAYFSLATMPFLGGSFLGNEEQVNEILIQQIHERTDIILLQPEWFRNKEDPTWAWMNAEISTRLGLVLLIWVTIISSITLAIRNNRKSNKANEPTSDNAGDPVDTQSEAALF